MQYWHFKWRILTIIGRFGVSIHSYLCERKYVQSHGLTVSCILLTDSPRIGLNPLNRIPYRQSWIKCHRQSLDKFDWGVCYVIIFLYVHFWLRLAAVSYRGKNIRTAASLAVSSVNKSHDTRKFVQNESQHVICVILTNRLCYKALGSILCCYLDHSFILRSPGINFVWSDMANTPQLQSSWRRQLWRYRLPQNVSNGHGWCHGDNQWRFRNDVIIWGTKIVLRSVNPLRNAKERWASHYRVF